MGEVASRWLQPQPAAAGSSLAVVSTTSVVGLSMVSEATLLLLAMWAKAWVLIRYRVKEMLWLRLGRMAEPAHSTVAR